MALATRRDKTKTVTKLLMNIFSTGKYWTADYFKRTLKAFLMNEMCAMAEPRLIDSTNGVKLLYIL